MIATSLIIAIVLSPLIGGVLNLTLRYRVGPSLFFLSISFICSLILVISQSEPYKFETEWLPGISMGVYIDRASSILLVLVSFISLLVHVFSVVYMESDTHKSRYFAKLGFFTFAMLGLLIADNLFLLFVFWELVGLASYLLIGFWNQKDGVPPAARLAFMINRVADVALLIGIVLVFVQDKSATISDLGRTWSYLPSILIAIGAFGKSAQLPFSGWLTKAMVGPTPVSALIHAATMVAAGVYLLYRVSPFLASEVLVMIAIVGSVTAIYGAISAITQNDIKKVLAYSTISQLGYMVTGVGVGAADAALFHLWTHAFFKAGLFLGAGSIIHYLHLVSKDSHSVDAQDMRMMGGLKNRLPWTFRSFLICALALAGIPLFSGFMSKEAIILSSWTWADEVGKAAYLIPDLLFITALLTAFYVSRMVVLIFLGEGRIGQLGGTGYKESWNFVTPLLLLATGSFWFFYQLNPFGHHPYLFNFLGVAVLENDSFTSAYTLFFSLILSLGGGTLAYFLFKPGTRFHEAYGASLAPATFFGKLLFNGFYLTNIYQATGKGIFLVSKSISRIDPYFIDGVIHFIGVGTVVFSKALVIFDRFIVDGLVNVSAWLSSIFGSLFSSLNARESQAQLFRLLAILVLILIVILLF